MQHHVHLTLTVALVALILLAWRVGFGSSVGIRALTVRCVGFSGVCVGFKIAVHLSQPVSNNKIIIYILLNSIHLLLTFKIIIKLFNTKNYEINDSINFAVGLQVPKSETLRYILILKRLNSQTPSINNNNIVKCMIYIIYIT